MKARELVPVSEINYTLYCIAEKQAQIMDSALRFSENTPALLTRAQEHYGKYNRRQRGRPLIDVSVCYGAPLFPPDVARVRGAIFWQPVLTT